MQQSTNKTTSKIPALNTALFNSRSSSVRLSICEQIQAQIAAAAAVAPDMREADLDDFEDLPDLAPEPSNTASLAMPVLPPAVKLSVQKPSFAEMMEGTAQALAKQYAGKSPKEIRKDYPTPLGERVIAIVKSQAPTLKQALGRHQSAVRAADAELGRAFAAAGIQVHHHSEKEFTHVIVTQLDMLQHGAIPSVSAVLHAAFPGDSKKAQSIGNSRHGKRRKEAWNSPEVTNHPMEIAMQATHGTSSMNRRHTAGTFGQSLGMNTTLFKSCDRITKLEARVQLLEQQMQNTKNREALADAGCTTSREKVSALYDQGKRQTEIAKLLDMQLDAVKYHIKAIRKK